MLIELEDKIISDEIFKRKFVCDLNRCKGSCCVLGDVGAPLLKEEVPLLTDALPAIKPYMSSEGIQAVESQGVATVDAEGEFVTPLVNGKECAFVYLNEEGVALCSIETASKQGVIPDIKPISCALYPIRVRKLNDFTAIQFDEWDICNSANACGERLGIPVYLFLKKPLIRAFGEGFFQELRNIAPEIEKLSE